CRGWLWGNARMGIRSWLRRGIVSPEAALSARVGFSSATGGELFPNAARSFCRLDIYFAHRAVPARPGMAVACRPDTMNIASTRSAVENLCGFFHVRGLCGP